jgi:peptidoglycan/LPS O-acetylase OafA/YrhL
MYEGLRTPMRHAWSLAIEEQFYLCWPALFYLFGMRRARWLAYVAMPLVALLTLAGIWYLSVRDHEELGDWTYYLPTTRLLSLSLGCSLAFAEPWLRSRPARIAALASSCVAGAALVIWAGHFRWHVPSGVDGTVGFALVSTSAVLVALFLHTSLPALAPLLANAPLRGLGRISYGLYLYHFPIYVALGVRYDTDHPSVSRIMLAPTLALLAAIVSYFCFERPILLNRDRIPTPVKIWKRLVG